MSSKEKDDKPLKEQVKEAGRHRVELTNELSNYIKMHKRNGKKWREIYQ